MQSIQSDYASL